MFARLKEIAFSHQIVSSLLLRARYAYVHVILSDHIFIALFSSLI